jgi:GNAT superfamily N-acetyltransferase
MGILRRRRDSSRAEDREADIVEWHIAQEPAASLAEYGRVPIAFRVDRLLEVSPIDAGLGGILLRERAVDPPYVKDYDAIEGNDPAGWASRWDVSNWGILSAFRQGRRVGGAVVVAGVEGLDMLENRTDLAVLWDLRVDHDQRRRGLGRALFAAAEGWARARGCRWLKVETQNINVPACRFYAGRGCVLGAINRYAYVEFPDEVQFLWYKDLGAPLS